jgi:N-acetylmuramoyl-L-alanine amidase
MGWLERITAIAAGVAVVASVSVIVARTEASSDLGAKSAVALFTPTPLPPTAPPPTPTPTPTPKPAPRVPTTVGALETTGITSVRAHATFASKTVQILTPGVLLPVWERRGDFYKVYTPNQVFGWVHASKAKTYAKAGGRPNSLKGATIVIDPGHGGALPGAKGPGGLTEKEANLGIARRLVDELAPARVFLTRGEGHAGLNYRSALANRLNAQAFVSVHNNALPDKKSKTPGSETYYQQGSKDSKRLAGLIYEELHAAFKQFNIVWGKDPFAGAKYRRGSRGHDYYAVLRRTLVPAVISEGMFITNGPEEALLRQSAVRELYAEALGRAIKRYFTTNDPGSGFQDPYAKPTPNCRIPGCFEYRK